MLFRPVRESDLNGLLELTGESSPGLTTLPHDRDYLTDRVNQSLRAFDERVKKPGGENYLFVLEDMETHKLVGTSGILSRLGGFEPFYTYKIKSEHLSDANLNVDKDVKTLHLTKNHSGPTEILSLFIKPEFRKAGFGPLLSLSRFLFIKAFPKRFCAEIISELRGVADETNRSNFWECVGRHFFECDFSRADLLSGLGRKDFIKNLMPHYPIYISMLPFEVQSIIGKVNKNSEPALKMLEKEGFRFNDEVDIFDAGPTVSVKTKDIRTLREAGSKRVRVAAKESFAPEKWIVSNFELDFRATFSPLKLEGDFVVLPQQSVELLNLREGAEVFFINK